MIHCIITFGSFLIVKFVFNLSHLMINYANQIIWVTTELMQTYCDLISSLRNCWVSFIDSDYELLNHRLNIRREITIILLRNCVFLVLLKQILNYYVLQQQNTILIHIHLSYKKAYIFTGFRDSAQ